jgi:hypothetical protein
MVIQKCSKSAPSLTHAVVRKLLSTLSLKNTFMMRNLMLLIFSLLFGQLNAQLIKSEYYDINWQKTDETNYDIKREIYNLDTLYQIKDFNNTGRLLMSGFSISIDTLIENGLFQFYNNKGKVVTHGNYQKGIMIGVWKYYDKKGKFIRQVDYNLNDIKCDLQSDKIKMLSDNNTLSSEPTFKGKAANSFRMFVSMNLVYPPMALKYYQMGEVLVYLTINEDGYVCDVKTKGKAHKDIHREIKRVVLTSPKWHPGYKDSKEVAVEFVFPVNFVIDFDRIKANVQQ